MDATYWEATLIFAGIITLTLLSGGIENWRRGLRARKLKALAEGAGLPFSPEWEDFPQDTGLELFTRGYVRRAYSRTTVPGPGGSALNFFDYTYTASAGRSSRTFYLSAALLELRSPSLPLFRMRPEGFFDRVEELLGEREIDIDGAPVFSKMYKLQGPDEAAVRAFFAPQRTACFEGRPGWSVQGKGRWLLFLRGEKQLPPDGWADFMEEVKAFAAELEL